MTLNASLSDNITIIPVQTKEQLALFIRLPRLLYKNLPDYTPPLDWQEASLLDPRKSAFFRYGKARYFIAYKSNHPVGRISAQIDPNALRQWKEPIGLFGALDAIDDPLVVKQLIKAAEIWLKKQGMEKIRGPYTLNANSEIGTMIKGQSVLSTIAMPWHPTWLAKHIEACGLKKVMDLLSYQMQMGAKAKEAHKIPSGLKMGSGRLGNITTRKLNTKEISRDGEILRQLYNDAWQNTWGFVPLTSIEMSLLIKDLKSMLKPENFVLVEQNYIPVAVALVIPNIYDIIQDVGPTPSPLGWAKLGYRIFRHQFHSARVILLGISRNIRDTALGALMPSLVISELFDRGEILPYKTIELGWILETNQGMRNLIERIVPEPNKIHRMYERKIEK